MALKFIGQDPVVTDGEKYSVVLENERVTVLRYHDKPGDQYSLFGDEAAADSLSNLEKRRFNQ